MRLSASLRSARSGEEGEGVVVDLSLAGACVELAFAVPPGDPVTLALVTPTRWDPLEVPARVAWARPPTYDVRGEIAQPGRAGLAFQHVTSESTHELMQVLASQLAAFD